jgi:O-antigen/teichoic acid export membrane protein
MKSEASLKKRYFLKLVTNLVGLGVGIGTQTIVPRALGPASYGDFTFLTNFFYQVVGFLNFNTSTAYYTKLSQRQHDTGLVRFYLYFTLFLGFVLSVFVALCFFSNLKHIIWPEQVELFIIFGAVWAFMTLCVMVLSEMSDAYGLTVKSELLKMALKVIGLLLVVILFWKSWLSLATFFLYQLLMLAVTIGLLARVAQKSRFAFSHNSKLNKEQLNVYLREFTVFSAPLVVFSIAALLEGVLDRWFLQKFSGSVQQGFYGLAYQIGTLCFFFSSALVPLVAREYAISFGKKDLNEMGRLFSRFVPMLYAITAYFACFIAVESKTIFFLFGGKAYAGAALPITIMCFYPILQIYGQMNASIFFATNRTIEYRNIGLAMIIVGLPLTFFLLGPKGYGALQAGATGLAAKMVFVLVISANVQLWYNTKILHLPYKRFFKHQVVVIVLFSFIALASSYIVRDLIFSNAYFLTQFVVSGFLYTLGIMGAGVVFPSLFAFKKDEILNLLRGVIAVKKLS